MSAITKPVTKFISTCVSDSKLLVKNFFSCFLRSLGRETVNDRTIMGPVQIMIQNAVLGALTSFSLAVGMGFFLFKQVIPRVIRRIRPAPPMPPRYLRKLKSQNGELIEEIVREVVINEDQFEDEASAQQQDD